VVNIGAINQTVNKLSPCPHCSSQYIYRKNGDGLNRPSFWTNRSRTRVTFMPCSTSCELFKQDGGAPWMDFSDRDKEAKRLAFEELRDWWEVRVAMYDFAGWEESRKLSWEKLMESLLAKEEAQALVLKA
jgi:hypothetical protein